MLRAVGSLTEAMTLLDGTLIGNEEFTECLCIESMLEQFTCYHVSPSNQPCVSKNEEGMWEAHITFSESHSK